MLTMFPPHESKTEMVELHTLDTMYDYITANSRYVHQHIYPNLIWGTFVYSLCPKFELYQEEFKNSSVWMKHQNVTNAVLNAISKAINFTIGGLLIHSYIYLCMLPLCM